MEAVQEQEMPTAEGRHEELLWSGQIVYQVPKQPGQGPPCIWDNFPTQRTGTCWSCPNCGTTTSC